MRLPVNFLSEQSGSAQIVMIYPYPYRRIVRDPDFVPDAAQFGTYAGLYANYREGDIIEGFYVGMKDGMLSITPAEDNGTLIPQDENRAEACTPFSQTKFAATSGIYDFALNADGSVAYVTKDLAFRYWRQSP